MSGLVDVVFNIELSLGIAIVTSVVLGALLLLINVPDTEYSRKLIKTKNTIAVCFFICTLIFYQCLKHSGIPDYETFSSLMMFVVTAISSAILSYSLKVTNSWQFTNTVTSTASGRKRCSIHYT